MPCSCCDSVIFMLFCTTTAVQALPSKLYGRRSSRQVLNAVILVLCSAYILCSCVMSCYFLRFWFQGLFFLRTFCSDTFIILKYKKKFYTFSKSLWCISLVLFLLSLTKNGEKPTRIFCGRVMVDTNAGSKSEIMLGMVFMMQSILPFAQQLSSMSLLSALRLLVE